LPNPHWIPSLRPLSGLDDGVKQHLLIEPMVMDMVTGLRQFLED